MTHRKDLVLRLLDAAYHLRAVPPGRMNREAADLCVMNAREARVCVDEALHLLGVAAGTTPTDADLLKLAIMRGEREA